MDTQLSEKKAKLHVFLIGIFYLISGIWEFLVGITQGESISGGPYFLLDVYRNYAGYLGLITIIVGILILSELNIARLAALALAWWNLFAAPLLDIWWSIYSIAIKKFLVTDSWVELWIYTIILISIMTFIRLYIINMLKKSKAGYVFLKKKNKG